MREREGGGSGNDCSGEHRHLETKKEGKTKFNNNNPVVDE